MGRARKNQEARQPYSIRLSLYEHALWEQRAEQAGMGMSKYFRHLLLTGGTVDGNAARDRRQLLREISAIGNNINQIAKWANANKYILSSELREVWDCLKEIRELVSKV